MNLPLACWLDAVGRPRAWPPGHRSGRRWVLLTKHLAGSAGELRRREWSARPFLASLRPPVRDGVFDPARPAARPRPLRAPRPPPAEPWLSCAVRVEGVRPAFAPRARWVLETLAEALGREPAWTDGQADLVYAPERPADGVWIPADDAAQAFFEGAGALPRRRASTARPA